MKQHPCDAIKNHLCRSHHFWRFYFQFVSVQICHERRMDDSPGEGAPLLHKTTEQDDATRATRKISRWITVEPIMVLYFMAFAPTVPLYEQFVYQQISERHNFSTEHNGSSQCNIDTNSTQHKNEELVQSEATKWLTYFLIATIIPMTVVMPFIGPYTDERGRKLAMYLPLLGAIGKLTVGTVIVAARWPFELLMIGSVIDGSTGGIVAIIMASFAYIADITNEQQRARRIFILEVSIGIGIVCSDIGIGYAINLLGYLYPFIILLGIHFVNLVYTFFGVQESIIKRENVKFFSILHVKKMWALLTVDNESKRRWKLQLLLVALSLINAIDTGNGDIQTYKLLKSPLCFTSVLIGDFTAVMFVIKLTFGAVILKLVYRYLKEIWMVIVSCLSATTYNFLFAFASSTEFVFLCEYVPVLQQPHHAPLVSEKR